jgi:hypothetical protein
LEEFPLVSEGQAWVTTFEVSGAQTAAS